MTRPAPSQASAAELIQRQPLERFMYKEKDTIVQASAADPYVVALTTEGQLLLLSLDAGSKGGQLSVVKANLRSRSKMVAMSAYKDTSGLFTKDVPEHTLQGHASSSGAGGGGGVPDSSQGAGASAEAVDEDEDDLLYGDSAPSLFNEAAAASTKAAASSATSTKSSSRAVPNWVKFLKPVKATYWLVGMRDNGNLEVMTLPDFTLKYVVPHFPLLPKVLTCAPRESWASDPPKCSYPEGTPTVSEILMVGLGGKGHGRRPLLMARLSDHEVAIYQAYPFYENCHRDKEGLKVQFKKIPHKLLLRERKGKVKKSERLSVNSNQLRYFNNVGSGQVWSLQLNSTLLTFHNQGSV